MIVRERVLLATLGHRDKDWMPPPTHQQLKSFSHATTKKVLVGEGLRLTSRVLVCFINSKLIIKWRQQLLLRMLFAMLRLVLE